MKWNVDVYAVIDKHIFTMNALFHVLFLLAKRFLISQKTETYEGKWHSARILYITTFKLKIIQQLAKELKKFLKWKQGLFMDYLLSKVYNNFNNDFTRF